MYIGVDQAMQTINSRGLPLSCLRNEETAGMGGAKGTSVKTKTDLCHFWLKYPVSGKRDWARDGSLRERLLAQRAQPEILDLEQG